MVGVEFHMLLNLARVFLIRVIIEFNLPLAGCKELS